MNIFSKPISNIYGIKEYYKCSSSKCFEIKRLLSMQSCSKCINLFCSKLCWENDAKHKKSCLNTRSAPLQIPN